MAKQAFRVQGTFKMGGKWSPFAVETIAADDRAARERVLSTLGSRHRVHRYEIKVDNVKAISGDEITDPAVEYLVSQGA